MKRVEFEKAQGMGQEAGPRRTGLLTSTGLTSRFARRFAREEGGNLTVMSTFMFVGIVSICGIGVDLMMNEMKRTNLQHTLDRAILAAADLDQKLEPNSVVQDYFETSGLPAALSSVTVDEGINYRTVSATASESSDPLFLKVMGVDELVAPASGTAEERVGNVEISLVLDISGSMGWEAADGRSKIENLHDAAREFVDTVINPDNGGLTTVSIVPYNATVNLGATLAQYYTLSSDHDYSRCATFPTSAFTQLGIARDVELQRLGHFDPWTSNWDTAELANSWCPTDDYGSILVHSDDRDELKTHIDALGAGGNTAIDLGMKWGVALLDPSAGSLVDDMIEDDHVTPLAENRPAEYDDREAMKIIVLMTDGENTTQFDLRPELRGEMSPVFIDDRGNANPWDDRFSVIVDDYAGTSNDEYYWVRYRNESWSTRYRSTPDGGSNARRMSNDELFARFGTRPVWERFFQRPYNDGQVGWGDVWTYGYGYTGTVGPDDADANLSAICGEARNAGITVFAIGFEAPQRGLDAMADCASSPSHYFDVEGVEITDAFNAIARTINQLRLTQ